MLGRSCFGSRHIVAGLAIILTCQSSIVVAGTIADHYTTALRRDTEELFYHGFENYMQHAFPEDELRPLTCQPLSRDRTDPTRSDLNDVLGNYSLTLVDSLSTLAILASSPPDPLSNKPWRLFQDGVKSIVELYGDGSSSPSGQGSRSRGFDLDSKVQVFETVIRGVGGLISAHQFAVGDLPIRDYVPPQVQVRYARAWRKEQYAGPADGIQWENGFVYDGQLLRLAYDLAGRIVPAFWTATGIPYPRVNLKHGIPFYASSPHNYNPHEGQCDTVQQPTREVTETCSAGAGSLVLEFTVLTRLTGDKRFENLAKRAFWAIWNRRSNIDLIGAGINAETGDWMGTITGIGASIDSFFEYAFKTYVLLRNDFHPEYNQTSSPLLDPNSLFTPLSDYEQSADAFLEVWEKSHTAIKRHVLRSTNYQHPHYVQVDMHTGAARAIWQDALSAYYPGLLTSSGYTEEAIQAHLLATALWARYSALPERWNLATGGVEGGLGWWIGRPEFVESNYFLYRATEDPWYKYVAEMVIRDVKRRCWTKCGWAGLQDVVTGEKSNRMESFFLGETAKYLFLTFDDDHPLNRLDKAFVFSTEGHPLIIPSHVDDPRRRRVITRPSQQPKVATCPVKTAPLPLGLSRMAARGDVYHAASLARLQQRPDSVAVSSTRDHREPDDGNAGVFSPSNFTFMPWTLPPVLVHPDAVSERMRTKSTFDISFPNSHSTGLLNVPLARVSDGVTINSLAGMRLSLIRDVPAFEHGDLSDIYRINFINGFGLGKDEKVYISLNDGFGSINPADPNFSRVRDAEILDIVVDPGDPAAPDSPNLLDFDQLTNDDDIEDFEESSQGTMGAAFSSLISQLAHLVQDSQQAAMSFTHSASSTRISEGLNRFAIAAIIPSGEGAAPIPDWPEASGIISKSSPDATLAWSSVFATDELCDHALPLKVARNFQVIVVRRGGCSFSRKLANIPAVVPSPKSIQLVVVVDHETSADGVHPAEFAFRPFLEERQRTPSGVPRQHPIPMVMITGGEDVYHAIRQADSVGIKRRYSVRTQGITIANLIVT